MDNIQKYFQAGYDGRSSERPPYGSSVTGMAFSCGVWCRANGITPHEIKPSRGYKWIINRTFVLDFKNDDYNPQVSRK